MKPNFNSATAAVPESNSDLIGTYFITWLAEVLFLGWLLLTCQLDILDGRYYIVHYLRVMRWFVMLLQDRLWVYLYSPPVN